jgi:hypothetical protein
MKEKYDILPGLFWIGLSIFAMIGSFKLQLGDFRDPGAGLMPFLIGALLFLVSIPVVLKSIFRLRNLASERIESSSVNLLKVVLVSGSLFAYCFLLGKLGYLITTTLLLVFLFKATSSKKWGFVISSAIITAVVTYYGFTFLGLRFPRGLFGV